MHFVLYTQASHPVAGHLSRGLSAAGHTVSVRNLKLWRGELERCDAVIVSGYRDIQRRIIEAYDVPSLVVDWGYFARVNTPSERDTGYWQISPYRLNNPPEFECESDRFEATGLKVKQSGGKKDGYALVCGQMPMDAAVFDHDHAQWINDQLERYDNAVYREHPRGGVKVKGAKTANGALTDALAGARLVVTHNSNVGHEALLAGVPVVCSECAPYNCLSAEKIPSVAQRKRYFNRAAYGQWLWSELADGVLFTMENLDRWNT